GVLAEALARRGRSEEARQRLEEALALVGQTGERLYEAELYRLRADIVMGSIAEPDIAMCRSAEEDYRRALDLARRQEAKALELRAKMSLTRLSGYFGQVEQTRESLAMIYGWFTEGFQTPDLRQARALLEYHNR